MTEGQIIKLDESNFDKAIKSGITLVDFYADWCGPCRMLAPVLEKVASQLSGQVQFAKVDIDKSHKIAANYQITSVPTMILYKNGEEVNRLDGLRDEKTIKDFVKSST